MTFQTKVNITPAPAVAGDFASLNPRASLLMGPGGAVAGANGVSIGQFVWDNGSGVLSNNWQNGRYGFVHRAQQGLITTFLAEGGAIIQPGMQMDAMKAGDFWAAFAAGASIGQKVYAYYADGTCYAAATATPPTGTVTASTATNTTLTVTADTGVVLAVGQPVSGTNIAAGTYISALGTGTGGVGTYTLSQATTGTGTGITVTATLAFETNFYVDSVAAAGELAKISTWG